MKALLIIDMQRGSFRPYSLRHDALGILERINTLAGKFRAHHYPVIFIQHDGTREDCFLPHSDDWELLPELIRLPTDITIGKTANDAFYNTSLHDLLSGRNVTELFVTGCATDYCVDATVHAALSRDYKVTVVADGHTTAAQPYIDAQTLIEHYNWVWSDMSPTQYRMEVTKAADIIV